MNTALSFYSLVAPVAYLTAVLILSQVLDMFAKMTIIAFLYKKFTILEKSNPSLSPTGPALITRRMPFIVSTAYVLLGEFTGCYLLYTEQLYDITNALYNLFTTGDLALVSLDFYVVYLLYGMKRGNPEARVILYRIIVLIVIEAAIKTATIFLFQTGLDPYWFYYMVSFPFTLILYVR